MSAKGTISYPYSTRELVNIVKHLEKFPDDSLASVLSNVSDFDHFSEHSDLKNTFIEVMHKHGIPIGSSSFQVGLAKQIQMPQVHPIQTPLSLRNIALNGDFLSAIAKLDWKRIGQIQESEATQFQLEQKPSRIQIFSELSKSWSLGNNQQILTDMLAVNENDSDMIYIAGIKPISVVQVGVVFSR